MKVFKNLQRVMNAFDSFYNFYVNLVWSLTLLYWLVQMVFKFRSFVRAPDEILSMDGFIFIGFSGFAIATVVWDFIQVFEN